MCDRHTLTDAYDEASLRILNAKSAAQLLLSSQPFEHLGTDGLNQRDFLLTSILEGLASADASLRVLSPYKPTE